MRPKRGAELGEGRVLQSLLSGIAIGAVYGLIAMALAITFYVTRTINFAQGQLMMITVMVTAEDVGRRVAGVAGDGCGTRLLLHCRCAVLSDCGAADPDGQPVQFRLAGFDPRICGDRRECRRLRLGADLAGVSPASRRSAGADLGTAVLNGQQVLAIAAALVLTVTFELVRRRTLFGKLGMAMAADPDMAEAIGGNTMARCHRRLHRIGRLCRHCRPADRTLDLRQPLSRRHVRHLRLHCDDDRRRHRTSRSRAMFGGLILGVCAEGANALINSQASDWFPFIVLVIILIFSPRGLFSSSSPLMRLRQSAAAET